MSSPKLTATSGTFEKFPFWLVLCDAQLLKFSGTLALIHPQKKKSISFNQGRIISTRSSLAEEATVQILIDSKRVKQEDVRPVLTELEGKDAMSQVGMFINMGHIQPAQVQEIFDYQTWIRVAEIFKWKEGRFAFVNETPGTAVNVPSTLANVDLVLNILYKTATNVPTDLSTIEVDGADMSLLLEHLSSLPFKIKQAVKKAVMGEVISLKKEFASSDTKEVARYLTALAEMRVLRMRKVQVQALREEKILHTVFNKKNLEERINTLKEMDAYSILQVKRDASDSEIKKNFFALAKQYHPDQLDEKMPAEVKKNVETVFSMISQAHASISDSVKRADYDSQLLLKESGFDSMQAEKLLEAEMTFQRGEALVKKGDFSGAVKEIARAITLNDSEADYYMVYGWALFKEGIGMKNVLQNKKAKDQLTKAVTMKPSLFQAHYYLGLIAKTEGDLLVAKDMFEKTVKLQPQHTEANSELRVMNMREQKSFKNILQKKKS